MSNGRIIHGKFSPFLLPEMPKPAPAPASFVQVVNGKTFWRAADMLGNPAGNAYCIEDLVVFFHKHGGNFHGGCEGCSFKVSGQTDTDGDKKCAVAQGDSGSERVADCGKKTDLGPGTSAGHENTELQTTPERASAVS